MNRSNATSNKQRQLVDKGTYCALSPSNCGNDLRLAMLCIGMVGQTGISSSITEQILLIV